MASRGVVIFLLAAIPILCLELRRGIPHLGIRDLILLCEEEEENEKRRKLVRKQQQEIQSEKTSRYLEDVLKPSQEMKLKKLEERFYQMTGETWKLSNGHKLGSGEDLVLENASLASFETSNREAAKRRKLPNSGTRVTAPVECPPQKKVLDLPEEPPETADEVVTVALRCPSGRFLRRRFFKSCQSQVLLDWMMKIGYHTSLYALSTSFPRRPLDMKGSWTLEDIGITVDTVLNVEEKEQSN
ncbi:PREDICTED: UBX domain-containing protein 8-like isoform X1 [Elephantulus edwardii]|uniref:UBX domain-containing protein 8-like isoform X1 n=1 Tax=Elephantulus edwardii TaxID=28737 RepID=UPI0003F07075|nr:PREDICTED: UBX domain-containing protein 8-like isoform X1 [Elephantulus edwardii]